MTVDSKSCNAMKWCGVALLLATAFSNVAELQAGSGGVISLPTGKVRNGLRLEIDTRWVDGPGYRPIRIKAINMPPGPTTADRTIRIVLRPRGWYGTGGMPEVTGYVEIPEKQSSGELTLSIPQSEQWNSIDVQAFEGGVELEDISTQNRGMLTVFVQGWSEVLPTILFIDDRAPASITRAGMSASMRSNNKLSNEKKFSYVGLMMGIFPHPGQRNGGNTAPQTYNQPDWSIFNLLDNSPKLELLNHSELPNKWIDYTSFDLAFVALDDLKKLVNTNSDKWRELRRWVASGGNLCVYNVEQTDEGLAELDQLLSPENTEKQDWQSPQSNNASNNIQNLRTFGSNSTVSVQRTPQQDCQFVSRRINMGHVFAIENDKFFSDSRLIVWLFNELGSNNWMWYQRHGMSLSRDNNQYWNFMVPGVGRAPVLPYIVLISLFVIAIGPVNYFLLRRKKRLYMLLITAPTAALAVTFALLNYALISDGLGTRVRIRSFTNLDQRTGQVASWSRQSYYSGLAPSEGLAYPETAAVFPIDQRPFSQARAGANAGRRITWDAGEQQLTAGYLKSRSTSQMMVVQSGESQSGLKIDESSGKATTVVNQLGAEIEVLLVCDSNGDYFRSEKVDADGTAQLLPIKPEDARSELATLFNKRAPNFPIGYDPSNFDRLAFGRRYSSYYYRSNEFDRNYPAPRMETNLLERDLYYVTHQGILQMKPRSYVTILKSSPNAPLGYQDASEEASLHVLFGKW